MVTVLNFNKPRDRSHYERFPDYHRSFYRFVEATSVTPFSGPALERGLAAVLVALARLSHPDLTPPKGAMKVEAHPEVVEYAAALVAQRAAASREMSAEEAQRVEGLVKAQGRNIFDSWRQLMHRAASEGAAERTYSPWEKPALRPLLSQVLDADSLTDPDELKFTAPTSMRDVEATSPLWLVKGPLGGRVPHGA
ncbi:MAG: hypothetical protein M3Y59_12490 [Myxococcota bacterium]|nr:hypothetical protein [Myxococcota bacterium]